MYLKHKSALPGRVASGVTSLIGLLLVLPACSDAHVSELSLASRGLYQEIRLKQISSDAIEYTPNYVLWSDGVQKRRWLSVPEGKQIDTSDMDHWVFPVGTKVWKEFSLDGVLLETRLVERVGETGRFEQDYKLATYAWDEDQRDAHELEGGVQNILGTDHNVPAQKLCKECHRGEPGGILGLSAIQLSGTDLMHELEDRNILSNAPGRSFPLPGDDATAAAIGYLHANCGHCHSDWGQSSSDMRLHFTVAELDGPLQDSALYRTTLNRPITEWKDHPARFKSRVVPGDAESSALYYRMTQRGDEDPSPDQMPPLATEKQHEEGMALIKAWIESLSQAWVDSLGASFDSHSHSP